jgi:hypothetical protein
MRQELINLLDGRYPEIAKAQTGLLRRIRRDSDDNKIECPCVDTITKEPDKDRYCICLGSGYFWDEEEIEFYKMIDTSSYSTANTTRKAVSDIGFINIPLIIFYVKYNADITEDDKIVELFLDEEGSAILPRKRKAIYSIEHAWDFRCDGGKLEYWRILTHKQTYKYLNTPSYSNV